MATLLVELGAPIMVTSVILRFQAPAQCPRRPAWPLSRTGHLLHGRIGEIEPLLEERGAQPPFEADGAAGRLEEGLDAIGRGRRHLLHSYLPPRTGIGLSPSTWRKPRIESLRDSLEPVEVRHSGEFEYL